MLDGIIFAKSGGNNHHSDSDCTVGNPGTVSGAFTANQVDRTAVPLQSGGLSEGASRGGDDIGRAVVAVAAYAGPEGDTAAAIGDTYGEFGASSSATPVVAGSAAVLKEHLIESAGTNRKLSSDVDRLRAAAFWHEPNLEHGTAYTANISMYVKSNTGLVYASGNSADHHQRLILGNVVQDKRWTIHLSGWNVPRSYDSDYYFWQQKRKVYVAMYWEDGDRDDSNGPDEGIQ